MSMKILLPLEECIASVYKTAARIKIRETHAIRAMTTRTCFIVYFKKIVLPLEDVIATVYKTYTRIKIMCPE